MKQKQINQCKSGDVIYLDDETYVVHEVSPISVFVRSPDSDGPFMSVAGDIMVEPKAAGDPVQHPSHYALPDETIKLIRRNLTDEEFAGYCKGNTIKYLCRMGQKPGVDPNQDWAKAGMYVAFAGEQ